MMLLDDNEENEKNDLNYYLYSLAALLRDYDGHTMDDDISDGDFPYSHDYPFIAHLKESDNFVNDVCAHLDVACDAGVIPYYTDENIDNGLTPSRRFLFTYCLVLRAIIPRGEKIAFEKVLTNKTGDENLSKILAKNNFGFGFKTKKPKRKRNTRKLR